MIQDFSVKFPNKPCHACHNRFTDEVAAALKVICAKYPDYLPHRIMCSTDELHEQRASWHPEKPTVKETGW